MMMMMDELDLVIRIRHHRLFSSSGVLGCRRVKQDSKNRTRSSPWVPLTIKDDAIAHDSRFGLRRPEWAAGRQSALLPGPPQFRFDLSCHVSVPDLLQRHEYSNKHLWIMLV